ncbi:MAG: hypothetical protein C0621_08285 [Desulfuromonas sp.]|nr:MAG: hypothetical protein C0621_08285 [Desulfuromonas sp.]
MKIYHKLLAAFGVFALLCALIGGFGWLGLRQTHHLLTQITDVHLPAVNALRQILDLQGAIHTKERELLLPMTTLIERQQILEAIDKDWQSADSAIHAYEALHHEEKELKLWERAKGDWQAWREHHQEMINLVKLVREERVYILESTLAQRRNDHFLWVITLEKAIEQGKAFDGELSPFRCALGLWLRLFEPQNPDLADALNDMKTPHQQLHRLGEEINNLLLQGDQKRARIRFNEEAENILRDIDEAFDYALTILRSDISLLTQAGSFAFNQAAESAEAAAKNLDQLAKINHQQAEEDRRLSNNLVEQDRLLALLAAILGGLLALGGGTYLARSLSRPIEASATMLSRLEQGDLDAHLDLDRRDEIGVMARAMNAMTAALRQVIGALRRTAGDVQQTAASIESSAQDISSGAKQQDDEICDMSTVVLEVDSVAAELSQKVETLTHSLDESSSSAQEMTGTVRSTQEMADHLAEEVERIAGTVREMNGTLSQSVDFLDVVDSASQQTSADTEELAASSTQVGELAHESTNLAEKVSLMAQKQGEEALDDVLRVTSENRNLIDEYSRVIDHLGESSANIGQMMEVIRTVAEKTNLLSLNAAIIASQAGEHGRSFAIVGEEIRQLSQTTTSSVLDIEQTIRQVQEGVASAIELVARILDGADLSLDASTRAKEVFRHIIENSQQASGMAHQIAGAARAQTEKCVRIRRATQENSQQIEKVKRMTTEQKQGSDMIVTSVERLHSVADRLRISAQEQADGTQRISGTLSDIHTFSVSVDEVCQGLRRSCQSMTSSLEKIDQIASSNHKSSAMLTQRVEEQLEQLRRLLPELDRFQISGSEDRLPDNVETTPEEEV